MVVERNRGAIVEVYTVELQPLQALRKAKEILLKEATFLMFHLLENIKSKSINPTSISKVHMEPNQLTAGN